MGSDTGIIKTLEDPVYLHRVVGHTIYAIDRECKVRTIKFDPTEYLFKYALVRHQFDQVLDIIRNSNLVGQSVISYLQKKGYAEVCLLSVI